MKPPAVGSVWVMKDEYAHITGAVPVMVLAASEVGVATTHVFGRPGRSSHPLSTFRSGYCRAPAGTPTPVVWPPAAEPEEGAQITRLGDVPVGWLFRDGWEEPGVWNVRTDDDGSYAGALVECRPPDGRDVILGGAA